MFWMPLLITNLGPPRRANACLANPRLAKPMTVGPIRRRNAEHQIQVAVATHLSWRGVPGLWFSHFPAGGWRTRTTGAMLKAAGTKAGVPDILLLANGRLFGLELKADRGRISPAQLHTHAEMRAAGATIGVATGIDEALELLGIWGLLR